MRISSRCDNFRTMKHYDRQIGFLIADDCKSPISRTLPSYSSLLENLKKYILSVAGWRCVFVSSGEEEDFSPEVKCEDLIIASVAARAFFDYLKKENAKILLGADARPTGTVLLDVVARTFIALGADVDHLFIASAPEIMAYSNDDYDGFFYISASHNPVGHNGLKFGASGGIFGKADCDGVLDIFKRYFDDEKIVENTASLLSSCSTEQYRKVLLGHDSAKRKSLDYYMEFVKKTASADDSFKIPFGIVAELNGSARSVSIDIPYLNMMGAKLWTINAEPRQIAHAIVPEGNNLEMCRKALEERYAKDHDYIIGYVPDNDGDRGNFVYIDEDTKEAKILHAQEVFALIVLIEVAHQALDGSDHIAIAANGPTSTRIDELASYFGAKVFRADVGEANVVSLAESLRCNGYSVHICGEGSNGGIITDPAKVRDPMNSIMSIAKLYSVPKLYSFIADKLSLSDKENVSLTKIINAIPRYTTTSAFSSEAVLRVRAMQFEPLKRAYEELFLNSWDNYRSDELYSYEVHQYEGSGERVGFGTEYRDENSAGGYQIVFYDKNGKFSAYLWLSKSKTEPVMRIMADIKGDDEKLYKKLLSWQKELVLKADAAL